MPAHNLLILLIWGQLTRPTNPQFRTLPALHLSQITHVDTLLKASQRERGEKKGFKDSDSILEDFQLLFVISFRGFRFCGLPKKWNRSGGYKMSTHPYVGKSRSWDWNWGFRPSQPTTFGAISSFWVNAPLLFAAFNPFRAKERPQKGTNKNCC